MNKIYIFFGLFLLASCTPSDIPHEKLEERQGVFYEVNSQIPYSGPIKTYYDNTFILLREGNYIDGKKEGLWQNYYKDGRLASEGNYIDGKKEGLWEFYHDNGIKIQILKSKGNYIDGKQEGLWEFYHDNSEVQILKSKGNYIDGKREGLWELYRYQTFIKLNSGFPFRVLESSKGNYIDGKQEGLWELYHDGILNSKGNYIDGKQEGLWELYHENGQLGKKVYFQDGEKLNSLKLKPADIVERNGVIYRINESNPVKGFVSVKYYHDDYRTSPKELIGEKYFMDGKQFGYHKSYHKNGQLWFKENWKDGKREGLKEQYYNNGQLELRENWKNGKREGLEEHYYNDGELAYKTNYKDGKREGLEEQYSNDGELVYKTNYKDGKREGLLEQYYKGQPWVRNCFKNDKQTDMTYCKK